MLDIEGWYDAFLAGGVENFTGMVADGGTPAARENQRLVIGPWDHTGWGRADSATGTPLMATAGAAGDSPINELMLAWFDHFLKGKGDNVSGKPIVDYFVMGANRWKTATAWPLPDTRWTTYYLSGAGGNGIHGRTGHLGTDQPKDAQPPDSYDYDPANPVPSAGGHSCCGTGTGPQGPVDQFVVEQRSDVLTYTTDPMATDTEITGPVRMRLWAASTAPDTDFTAKLVALAPDGSTVNLNSGIIRAAFRDSLEHPAPIEPGRAYPYNIAIWPTSYLVKAGYRIRVEVSSSDFPQFAPNPNTGEPFGTTANSQLATQTIYHDAEHPSALILPVIPGADTGSTRFPVGH